MVPRYFGEHQFNDGSQKTGQHSNHAGAFQGSATAPTIPIKSGVGIEPGAESATAVAYYPDIILKFIG